MTRLDNLPLQLDFEGPNNFRDMGGYPLDHGLDSPLEKGCTFRYGRLYRSDHLTTLTDADQRLLAELGIRTVIARYYDGKEVIHQRIS